METKDMPPYNWLSDDDYAKLKFRTRAHVTLILSETRKWYGQANIVDGQTEALMHLFEQTWDIVRGKDRPITLHPFVNRYRGDSYGADD